MMKAMNSKLFRILLIPLCATGIVSGQTFSEKKIVEKSFPANGTVTLEVNNKYGTIHITSWDKDSVAIKAEIDANSQKADRLKKIMDGIDIDISENSYMIGVETEFDLNFNMLFESFKGMTNNLIPYDSRIQVNYYISAPDYLNMRIINRYGDVYMENNSGKFELELANGSFKANSLKLESNLVLTFCDATINKIAEGKIEASFSEIVVGEADDLTINSSSSRIDVEKGHRLTTDSRRDKFFIDEVESLQGSSYFTDFRIDELNNELKMASKYGSIRVSRINRTVEKIDIYSGYLDINLTLDREMSYSLQIKHTNTVMVLPEDKSGIKTETLDEEKKEYFTKGTIGASPVKTDLKIDAVRGNIFIR